MSEARGVESGDVVVLSPLSPSKANGRSQSHKKEKSSSGKASSRATPENEVMSLS